MIIELKGDLVDGRDIAMKTFGHLPVSLEEAVKLAAEIQVQFIRPGTWRWVYKAMDKDGNLSKENYDSPPDIPNLSEYTDIIPFLERVNV